MKEFLRTPAGGKGGGIEAFRPEILPDLESLFAALSPYLQDRRPFFYMASSEKAEGSSIIAKALAYFIALREGEDCLYVDGNVSNPSIKIRPDMPEAGLSDFLRGTEDFRLFPFQTEIDNLSAVHAGDIGQHYVALSEERARYFRDESTKAFRAVVFDAKPGFDKYGELWGGLADAVLIVTSYRKTKSSVLQRMVSGFNQAGIPVTGLIFNKRRFPVPEFIYRRI